MNTKPRTELNPIWALPLIFLWLNIIGTVVIAPSSPLLYYGVTQIEKQFIY